MSNPLFADVGLVHFAIETVVGEATRFRAGDQPFDLRDFHASVELRIRELEETVRVQATALQEAVEALKVLRNQNGRLEGELAAERAARRRLRGRKVKTIELERDSHGAVTHASVYEGGT